MIRDLNATLNQFTLNWLSKWLKWNDDNISWNHAVNERIAHRAHSFDKEVYFHFFYILIACRAWCIECDAYIHRWNTFQFELNSIIMITSAI